MTDVSQDRPAVSPPSDVHLGLVARNIVWLSSGELLTRGMAFAAAVYLARIFGASAYGSLGVALAISWYFIVPVDAGLDPISIRETARAPGRLPAILSQVGRIRLSSAFLVYGVLLVVAFLLPQQAIGSSTLALIYGLRLFTYAFKFDWGLKAREQMKAVTAGLVIQHLVYVGAILLLLHGPSPYIVLVPIIHVVGEAVFDLACLAFIKRSYDRLWTREKYWKFASLLREAIPVGFGKGLRVAYYEGDMIMIGLLSVPEQAGYFMVSHRLILSLMAQALLYQFNAFPAVSRLTISDPERGKRFQNDVSRFALLWSVPVTILGIFLSPFLIQTLFGHQYAQSAPIFSIMLFALPLQLLSGGIHNQMIAAGNSKAYLRSVLAGTIVHIVLGILWIPAGGGVAAARASVLGEFTILCVALGYVWKSGWPMPLSLRTMGIVAAGGAMVAGMYFLRHLHPLSLAVAGSVPYFILVILLGGVSREEVRLLRRVVLRRHS